MTEGNDHDQNSLSETAALRALLSETSDTNLLAEMLGFVADRLVALDVDQLCGAGAHERSEDRMNRRNGYDAGYSREEPGAGKPHARICDGESRMAELLDHYLIWCFTLQV